MVSEAPRLLPQFLREFTNKATMVQTELGFCQVCICRKRLDVTQSLLGSTTAIAPISWSDSKSIFLWISMHGSPGSLVVV